MNLLKIVYSIFVSDHVICLYEIYQKLQIIQVKGIVAQAFDHDLSDECKAH